MHHDLARHPAGAGGDAPGDHTVEGGFLVNGLAITLDYFIAIRSD